MLAPGHATMLLGTTFSSLRRCDAEIGGGYFSAAGGDTSGELHMVLILVAAGLQLYRRPQVDRLFQRHAPVMLSGKPAVGAFLCTKPDEAR